ncbi:hypothetical protein BV22DRAFT_786065 [Leucogyrophana mollusca]|uniref:Uncharacterized protein n=1 Tax=Leucogyrophana mollusca TaxID=85980 RepID=A0ACB8B709_9AGAM|nr:hypothetical protein BV22DRAFT_786065 [Leucogyrophana mollusca]
MPLDVSPPAATLIALTFSTASPYRTDFSRLSRAHPSLAGLQPVGAVGPGGMADVQVFSVQTAGEAVLDALRSLKDQPESGILSVDVQEKRWRAKRDNY